MRVRSWILVGALITAVAMVIAVLAGLLMSGGPGEHDIVSVRGQTVTIYGEGLYRHMSTWMAAQQKGTDIVTLLFVVPAMLYAAIRYRANSLRGGLLLAGTFVVSLYVYATMALATIPMSRFFPLYVLIMAISLWSLIYLLIDVAAVSRHTRLVDAAPRKFVAIFLLIGAAATFGIWAMDPIAYITSGTLPAYLGTGTTLFTHALDSSVLCVSMAILGWRVLHHERLAYLLAFPLITLAVALLPMIVIQTIMQIRAGIDFTPQEIVGPILGFALMGVCGLVSLRYIWTDIREA